VDAGSDSRRSAPGSEPQDVATIPKQAASVEGFVEENPVLTRIFEEMGGKDLGYTVRVCNDSTYRETPTSRMNIGLNAMAEGGAFPDPDTKTIWVHESVVARGGTQRDWGKLNLAQVVAHELGHIRGGRYSCAHASRLGADLPGLTAAERLGLLNDAWNIGTPREDPVDFPPDFTPPTRK
jgi:hypothetical protein